MMQLPDPIQAADAALFPELVTLPALIQFAAGGAVWMRLYQGTDANGNTVPAVALEMLNGTQQIAAIGLDLGDLRGAIAALQTAADELEMIGGRVVM